MGHPVKRQKRQKRQNYRPANSSWGYMPGFGKGTAVEETREKREAREQLIAEHLKTKGVTRLPCLYRPLP